MFPSNLGKFPTPIEKFVIAFMLLLVSAIAYGSITNSPKEITHQYKVAWSDESAQFEGTGIESNGLCVEIKLHGRIDTIACGIRYVTEMLPQTSNEQPVTPEEPPKPEPQRGE